MVLYDLFVILGIFIWMYLLFLVGFINYSMMVLIVLYYSMMVVYMCGSYKRQSDYHYLEL